MSSGTAANIFQDLKVGKQATASAQRQIEAATASLNLKGYPPAVLIYRTDRETGKVTLTRKTAEGSPSIPKIIARGNASVTKKTIAKKTTGKKKTAKKKTSATRVSKRKSK